MDQLQSHIETWISKLKSNPVIIALLFVGTVVTGLSSFTSATKNLKELVIKEKRPAINGEWKAEVTYDWGAHYPETFSFTGDGNEVHGTASFLNVGRGILQGKIVNNQLQFVTKTQETIGDQATQESSHRYSGKIEGNRIIFTMQTEGGISEHKPVDFVAQRILTHP